MFFLVFFKLMAVSVIVGWGAGLICNEMGKRRGGFWGLTQRPSCLLLVVEWWTMMRQLTVDDFRLKKEAFNLSETRS